MHVWAVIVVGAAVFVRLWEEGRSYAASQADIDKLTTYATIFGRAFTCSLDIDGPSRRVDAWVEEKFPPGKDRVMAERIFTQGVQYGAQMQAKRYTPDSCAEVARGLRSTPWP
jgi:hypothetical protein